MYGFLADLMVVLHVAYVGFVLVGQVLILAGWVCGWQWTRNRWFRLAHLAAIAFVAFEEFINMDCPLTVWERQLRELAGQPFSGETFLSRLMHAILFFEAPPIVFTMIHLAFAAIVMGTFILYPPKWQGNQRHLTPAH